MKDNVTLLDYWEIGNVRGRNRAVGIVTVEPAWHLNVAAGSDVVVIGPGGPDPKGPYRYFQGQQGVVTPEVEVPNIKSIQIDRSVDTDAGTCRISIYNQSHETNLTAPSLAGQLGTPGFFTATRGSSPEALARWNHIPNEWAGILVPNALLRTYQGYGGWGIDGSRGTLADLVGNGNVTITGTWLIDRVATDAKGMISLECRDMAKLLMDQIVYVPLVPPNQYPAKFYRWKSTNFDPIWDPGGPLSGGGTPQTVPLGYLGSSSDILLGGTNLPVLGHFPLDAIDGSLSTYAMGFGWDSSQGVEVTDWWEFSIGQQISTIYFNPWGGPYTVYFSVSVGGVWQGAESVPFSPVPFNDPSIPGDGNSADLTGANIPFVLRVGSTGDGVGLWYDLPGGPYTPDRIRISIRDIPLANIATRPYRSGIREVFSQVVATTPGATTRTAFAIVRNLSPTPANGYRVIDQFGQQFSFGTAAANLTENAPVGISTQIISGVTHPTGNGFWTVETNGRVHAFGTSQKFFGTGAQAALTDAVNVGANDFVDIAATQSGNGYWLLRRTGGVYTFGDAGYLPGVYLGAATVGEIPSQTPLTDTAMCMAGDPGGPGYWIVSGTGKVGAFGGATLHGELTAPYPAQPARACSIEPTPGGLGYWLMYNNGQVFHYGDATGQPTFNDPPLSGVPWAAFIKGKTDDPLSGAWALRQDGYVFALGSAQNFGNPLTTGGIILTTGNYLDYTDVIKELCMWAGFALPNLLDVLPTAPAFHGNLATTGAWAEEPLAEDIFDKRPVIDPLHQIKEIVGYILRITEEGGVIFDSPNWWAPGNFFEDGSRTATILEVDERRQLFDYSINVADTDMRSEIMITNQLPNDQNDATITTRFIPPGQNVLRGMVRPAIWSNEVFNKPSEQQVMAELIALHIWFAQRQGSVTCMANPIIQIDDQIRIWERTTAESYIHYVRGISTSMDLDTGEYISTITTHWLGSEATWVIQAPTGTATTDQNNTFRMSPQLLAYLGLTGSQAVLAGLTSNFSGSP